jgi:GNAT superfamily N-acetyltransferase
MLQATRDAVDGWWRDVFGVSEDVLWSSVTVCHPHRYLGDYEGWYVAWREAGVHMSAPDTAEAADVTRLREEPAPSLRATEFWHAFGQQRGLVVIGPGLHRYLDVDPGPADGVTQVRPSSLLALRERVSAEDWDESGFEDALDDPRTPAFATPDGGAVLTDLAGAPRNLGLLVAADARGAGLGHALGRAATSYAVRAHGYARWRCRDTNLASARVADQLGFEPYVTQLAVRPASA